MLSYAVAEWRLAQLLPSPTPASASTYGTQRRARRSKTRLIYKILATPFVLGPRRFVTVNP